MKIVISGGTGLIGTNLTESFLNDGHDVVILTRKQIQGITPTRARYVYWDAIHHDTWASELEGADVVINLAGVNIGETRWSTARKMEIENSRVFAGKVLADAISKLENRPKMFVQASAIGYYGISLTETFTENNPAGSDYFAGIAARWEDSTAMLDDIGVRRAVIRSGVVLDAKKGALNRMLLPFALFVGGPLGSGKQWLSWIHMEDEINAIKFIINQNISGIFNLTAPNPVTNARFGKAVAGVMHRPYWFPVPGFAIKILFGEMGTLVLDGQRVIPERLIEAGYTFKFPDIDEAIRTTLRKET